MHSAFFPLLVVTVILDVPSDNAVTNPLFTLTTFGLLLVHVTFLFVVFDGLIFATNVEDSPIYKDIVDLFSFIDVASIFFTVTVHSAFFPLLVVTVILDVPSDSAVTNPLFTLTTLGLLLVHVTFLSVVSTGKN